MRRAAVIGLMMMTCCLAWGDGQKEFIYLDGGVIATESSPNNCTYTAYTSGGANYQNITATDGSTHYIAVSTSSLSNSNCSWTAGTNAAWIHSITPESGSTNGTVSYSVETNETGSPRIGVITIGGHDFTVIQSSGASSPPPQLSLTWIPATGVLLTWNFGPEYTAGDEIEIIRYSTSSASGLSLSTNASYYLDSSCEENKTYVYQIRDSSISGTISNYVIAMTFNFTDDPLTPGTAIKAQHIRELRDAIGDLAAAKSQTLTWTYSSPNIGDPIRAADINDLRNNLGIALPLGFATPTYTDTQITTGQTIMKAVHIQEIRNAIKQ
jgi:hypothetical protein